MALLCDLRSCVFQVLVTRVSVVIPRYHDYSDVSTPFLKNISVSPIFVTILQLTVSSFGHYA